MAPAAGAAAPRRRGRRCRPPPPPAATIQSLPREVWLNVPLDAKDACALASTCRDLRAAMAAARCARGLSTPQADLPALLPLLVGRWAALQALRVRGVPRRYGGTLPDARQPGLPVPSGLAALRCLTLHHCRMPEHVPARPFWAEVFAACPRLKSVAVVGDYFLGNYARDVNHAIDLVVHGAPLLERLDLEGSWLVFRPRAGDEDTEVGRAVARVAAQAPVRSSTLRHYRAACKQAPVGVDAPLLEAMDVEEPADPPYLACAARLGPGTLAGLRRLTWRQCWPAFDAARLGAFSALRELDIHLGSACDPARASACLRTLSGLPRSLRRLALHLDVWRLRPPDPPTSDIAWGRPLQHLDALEELDVRMLFPPSSVGELLAGWLGAGPGLRLAAAAFEEPVCRGYEYAIRQLIEEDEVDPDDEIIDELRLAWERACQPVPGEGLAAWLDARPGGRAAVRGLGDRLACAHPRALIT